MSGAERPVEAAARARRQATAVAAVGAVVPTILAAQGMTYLAVDLLGFPLVAAVALAGFLELALVSSALLARASALAGRPGGADALAVWVVSATSGLLAGVHELMAVAPDGTSTWSADPGSVLAAAVRVVAPLVAAWLWERVLQAARAEQAERTLAEVRRDRRLLEVARAALMVRRLDEAGRSDSRRARRAARRLDRAHVAALRVAPPPPRLADVLGAVGQVDHLPAATSVRPLSDRTDSDEAPDDVADEAPVAVVAAPAQVEAVADRTPDEEPEAIEADPFSGARVVEDYVEAGTVADRTDDDEAPDVVADDHGGPDTLALADEAPVAVVAAPAQVEAVADRTADDEEPVADRTASEEAEPTEAGAGRAVFAAADGWPSAVSAKVADDDGPDTLALAVEVVRADPMVSGAQLADELTRRGRSVSTRSGQRWRARALAAMAEGADRVTVG